MRLEPFHTSAIDVSLTGVHGWGDEASVLWVSGLGEEASDLVRSRRSGDGVGDRALVRSLDSLVVSPCTAVSALPFSLPPGFRLVLVSALFMVLLLYSA